MFCCYAENDHNNILNSAADLSTNTAYSQKPFTDTEREEGSFQILDPLAMEVSSNLAYGTNSFKERDSMVLSSRNDSQLEQDTIYDYID